MRKVTLEHEEQEREFILLNKDELAALLSVSDKNPRSHWVWVDYGSVTVWAAGATRIMRCKASARWPGEWQRVPIKALKELKALQQDAILIRHPHPDVVELTKVRFPKKGWAIEDGQSRDNLPEALEATSVRLSVPAPGTTDYTLETLESALELNTGAPVPKVRLSPAHLGPVAKLDAATGKKSEVSLQAGQAGVPCIFEITNPADGSLWTYALMAKAKQ